MISKVSVVLPFVQPEGETCLTLLHCVIQASAAFKAINEQLGSLPRDSPEKAEIFAECGLHLLLEARRCKEQHQPDDARTKAQRAVECIETSIKREYLSAQYYYPDCRYS